MRPRTVDLLRIRDGEPVDANVRAAVETDPALIAELGRLTDVRRELEALPAFAPPPDAWPAIESRLAQLRATRPAPGTYWLLRASLAVCVAVATLAFVLHIRPVAPPVTIVGNPAAARATPVTGTAAYASLVQQSARLERALDGLGPRSPIVRVGTATTIADLESSIAAIDTRLMFAGQLGLDRADRESLHRQRVEIMNALWQVRYADQMRYVNATHDSDLRRFGY